MKIHCWKNWCFHQNIHLSTLSWCPVKSFLHSFIFKAHKHITDFKQKVGVIHKNPTVFACFYHVHFISVMLQGIQFAYRRKTWIYKVLISSRWFFTLNNSFNVNKKTSIFNHFKQELINWWNWQQNIVLEVLYCNSV